MITDNCPRQNKNNAVLQLANVLVDTDTFEHVALSYLIKGYSKNYCNRSFNLMKLKYHESNVHAKKKSLKVLGINVHITLVNSDPTFFKYCKIYFDIINKKHLSRTIVKTYLFNIEMLNPTVVSTKNAANCKDTKIIDL